MIDAVIFDMDGVLIDSVESANRAKTELLKRQGIDINTVPDPTNEGHKGSSVRIFLDAVERHHGVKIDRQQFARDAIEFVHKDLQQNGVSADTDLINLLKELQSYKIPCGIASSGLRESVNNKLRILGIKEYFQIIITGDDVKEHKPHPAPYILTIGKLNARPDKCLVFEDSLVGVQAAQAAGCTVIGFTGYNTNKNPLPGCALTVDAWNQASYNTLSNLFLT